MQFVIDLIGKYQKIFLPHNFHLPTTPYSPHHFQTSPFVIPVILDGDLQTPIAGYIARCLADTKGCAVPLYSIRFNSSKIQTLPDYQPCR